MQLDLTNASEVAKRPSQFVRPPLDEPCRASSFVVRSLVLGGGIGETPNGSVGTRGAGLKPSTPPGLATWPVAPHAPADRHKGKDQDGEDKYSEHDPKTEISGSLEANVSHQARD
jgi:hypothetical protein